MLIGKCKGLFFFAKPLCTFLDYINNIDFSKSICKGSYIINIQKILSIFGIAFTKFHTNKHVRCYDEYYLLYIFIYCVCFYVYITKSDLAIHLLLMCMCVYVHDVCCRSPACIFVYITKLWKDFHRVRIANCFLHCHVYAAHSTIYALYYYFGKNACLSRFLR